MEILLLLLAIGVVAMATWSMRSPGEPNKQGAQQKSITPPTSEPAPAAIPDELQLAMSRMRAAIDACQADHPDALSALSFMAASDGKISRQELRIIIGLCQRLGTHIKPEWEQTIEILNAGLNISTTGSLSDAMAHMDAIAEKDLRYRAAVLGAAEAIVASNKTSNATKRVLLDRARTLI